MQRFVLALEKIQYFQILLLFAFIPLYPKFPLINITGTFVAIRLEDLLIGLTVAIWLIYITLSNKVLILLKDNLTQAILLFFFVGLVSTFSAIFLTHTVVSHLSILHFLRRVEFIMLLPLVATIIKTKKQLVNILILLAVVVFVACVYGLGQIYLDWPVISTTNSEFAKGLILRLTPDARVNSTFAGHYDFAVFLAMSLIILSPLFFVVKKAVKLPLLLLSGLSLFVLILTAARQSFIAAFIGTILGLILSNKKKYILIFLLGAIIILIYPSQLRDRFISTITVNFLKTGQRYQGKTEDQQIRSKLNIPTLAVKTSSLSANMSTFATASGSQATDITPGEPVDTTQLGVYRSLQIRLNIEWPRAIRAFVKNPFLGTGYSSIDIATDNDFLRSLGEVGFLGTVSLILIFVTIGKKTLMGLKDQSKILRLFSAGVFAMMVAFIINGLFIDVFEASKVASLFWMMMGLSLSIFNFKND